ncbi:lactate dehydrogenase-like 2-hydroxyacid dehydrogenase [Roseospira goensis]|uniref:Lactate dehydrogenase-like 2-hydroxyacid dehydrogenase n=1 Tax=Roseospira goensis TaxID=391922 RepID=A0A7W6WKW9_9PROT|nr:lactate dehydrogenase-like 2-hydroxyacid dehydrogenase [Roseospira goensis]
MTAGPDATPKDRLMTLRIGINGFGRVGRLVANIAGALPS